MSKQYMRISVEIKHIGKYSPFSKIKKIILLTFSGITVEKGGMLQKKKKMDYKKTKTKKNRKKKEKTCRSCKVMSQSPTPFTLDLRLQARERESSDRASH